MYFTCEVHNQRFATLQALKQHDTDYHSQDKLPATNSRSRTKRKGNTAHNVQLQAKKKVQSGHSSPTPTPYDNVTFLPNCRNLRSSKNCDNDNIPFANQDPTEFSLPFQCHICQKSFHGVNQLNNHIESHLEDNPLSFVKTDTEIDTKDILIVGEVDDSTESEIEIIEESSDVKQKVEDEDDVEILCVKSTSAKIILEPGTSKIIKKLEPYLYPCRFCTRRFKALQLRKSHIMTEHFDKDHEEVSDSSDESSSSESDDNGDDPDYNYDHESDESVQGHDHDDSLDISSSNNDSDAYISTSEDATCNPGTKPNNTGDRTDQYSNHICYFCGHVPGKMFSYLERHIRTHTLERPYSCLICNKRCKDQEHVDKHQQTHNDSEDRIYKCKICRSCFRDRRTLDLHMLTHSDNRDHQCTFCAKAYKRSRDLWRHIKCSHSQEAPYKCKVCPRAFKRKDMLINHYKVWHPDYKSEGKKTSQHKCELSGILFETELELQRHSKWVHSDSHLNLNSCHDCNQIFKKDSDLKKHVCNFIRQPI